jgi:hypothetical protein
MREVLEISKTDCKDSSWLVWPKVRWIQSYVPKLPQTSSTGCGVQNRPWPARAGQAKMFCTPVRMCNIEVDSSILVCTFFSSLPCGTSYSWLWGLEILIDFKCLHERWNCLSALVLFPLSVHSCVRIRTVMTCECKGSGAWETAGKRPLDLKGLKTPSQWNSQELTRKTSIFIDH